MVNFKTLSVSDLISRLHDAIASFIKNIEDAVDMNNKADMDEIITIRDHITKKLQNGEDIKDNTKIIELLDLLSRDKMILEVVKDDASEWLDILEAIEGQMAGHRPMSEQDKQELIKINAMTGELKELIRK